jgi:protoheme IX farnesyltransferase
MKDKLTMSARWPLPTLPTRARHAALRLPHSAYRRLTLATAGAVWMLIVLGGLVRVTDSGTGCGASWPMCHGHLFPSLEYHELIEWNHRLFATLGGFLMVVTVGATLLWYRRDRRLAALAIVAAATYLGQAILGGITVLLHLDQTWVAAHMGNSMLLLASVVLLALFARQPETAVSSQQSVVSSQQSDIRNMQHAIRITFHVSRFTFHVSRLRALALGTTLWTYIALFTGSAVVGARADLACPAWPQCAGTHLLPGTGGEWINFGHRIAVGLSDVLMLVLVAAIWATRRTDRRLLHTSHALAALYVSQVFLGAFTIWLGAPAALKGAHLALAAATWAALVVMTAFVWIGPVQGVGGQGLEVGGQGSGTGEQRTNPQPPTPNPQYAVRHLPRTLARRLVPETVRLYVGLMRPHVIPLLLVPTVAAMLIAAVQQPPQRSLLALIGWTVLGGTLAAGGAHAINQYLDRDIDARMRRTSHRAVVTGRITPGRALAFGIALSALGCAQLWLTVNAAAALLAVAGNLFYVFVYTLWLKRTSVQNIVIGGAAGAVPPLVGWAAVTGGVGLPALLFFAIIFFWTPAHFWALALVRQEDYREAGIPMLPVVRGEATTRLGILRYALLLVGATLLPVAIQALGGLYLLAAGGLGVVLVWRAVELARLGSPARAWRLFKFSNTYLALLYLAMVVDRLLAWAGGLRL